MENWTQHKLIIAYLKEYKEITPAKMGGRFYQGHIFGSEVSKRCRELRKKGILASHGLGKFTVFYLKSGDIAPIINNAIGTSQVDVSPDYQAIEEEAFKRMIR